MRVRSLKAKDLGGPIVSVVLPSTDCSADQDYPEPYPLLKVRGH